MLLSENIAQNTLSLIPVLMVIGEIVKGVKAIDDRWIPLILLPIGVLGSLMLNGASADAAIRGVLAVGAAIYGDQLEKQIFRI